MDIQDIYNYRGNKREEDSQRPGHTGITDTKTLTSHSLVGNVGTKHERCFMDAMSRMTLAKKSLILDSIVMVLGEECIISYNLL